MAHRLDDTLKPPLSSDSPPCCSHHSKPQHSSAQPSTRADDAGASAEGGGGGSCRGIGPPSHLGGRSRSCDLGAVAGCANANTGRLVADRAGQQPGTGPHIYHPKGTSIRGTAPQNMPCDIACGGAESHPAAARAWGRRGGGVTVPWDGVMELPQSNCAAVQFVQTLTGHAGRVAGRFFPPRAGLRMGSAERKPHVPTQRVGRTGCVGTGGSFVFCHLHRQLAGERVVVRPHGPGPCAYLKRQRDFCTQARGASTHKSVALLHTGTATDACVTWEAPAYPATANAAAIDSACTCLPLPCPARARVPAPRHTPHSQTHRSAGTLGM